MCFQVTVNAVVSRVDLTAEKPFGFRRIPFECLTKGRNQVSSLAARFPQNLSGSVLASS